MNFKQSTLVFLGISTLLILGIIYMHFPVWILLLFIMLYLLQIVLGAIYIQRNFFITSIHQLNTSGQKEICLTFDDGIDPQRTPLVLDILKKFEIKAMFFLIGKNCIGHESILKRIFDEGHQIGNHSQLHEFWFDMKSSREMLREMEMMNEQIIQILGPKAKPKFFRPPYGVTNPNLAKAIKKSGMISVGWNLRSMDTVAKSKHQLLNSLKKQTRPGSIILLHDRCLITVDTLTDYIEYCQQQGYTFTVL